MTLTSATSTTQAVVNHHLERFAALDLQGVVADYAPGAVMIVPTGHSTMHMYPIDGAASRVPQNATAFAYRDGGWAGVIVGVDPDPANAGLISQWARDYWEELHPTSAGGAYVNFLMNEGQDRVKASYRGNYTRLAQIKDRYDPDNIFHINQNIQPASRPGA